VCICYYFVPLLLWLCRFVQPLYICFLQSIYFFRISTEKIGHVLLLFLYLAWPCKFLCCFRGDGFVYYCIYGEHGNRKNMLELEVRRCLPSVTNAYKNVCNLVSWMESLSSNWSD
jgi:hypothetical protein